ncbi:dipeptidyl-peptidase 8-like serine peptidase [Trypanosoma rangeli SC58]|uniref:Dipeptidyl-peptidase 8-like serine peptidase n=2 Tax=Trypanosoma rangeli SC58 TaxID=429131 RepID=A0A061J5I8_TRYRA|nr:dipeptidyl-peptidase 8-like serine peptidase [Trypanosoma rangeli SC58]
MSKVPLTTYIEQLKALDGLLKINGKPQHLRIVGDELYWLEGTEQTLYAVSLLDRDATPRRVIASQEGAREASAPNTPQPKSKEEELLRERLRRQVTGITNYHIAPSDGTVFYTAGTNMFLYRPSTSRPPLNIFDYIDKETRQRYFADEKKPFLCIQHLKQFSQPECTGVGTAESLNVFSFVYGSNVYIATVVEQNDAEAAPLHVDVECVTTFGDTLHECGTADYIMQEEFSRYTGHYATEKYVLFSYTDTSMLQDVSFIDGSSKSGVEKMPYSRVGGPNAHTLLVVYERKSKCFRVVPEKSIAAVAPWAEYVPRFGFKDADTIYFSVLSRTQERYCVLSCCIETLPLVDVTELSSFFTTDAATCGAMATIVTFNTEWEEHIPWAWVEVPQGPPILFGATHDILLRHAVETETAHCHLYIRDLTTDDKKWRALTQGEWNVKPDKVSVLRDQVVFMANADSRLGSLLYSVPLGTSSTEAATAAQLTRLSPLHEHVYTYAVVNGCVCYVASTAMTPPELYIASLASPESRRRVEIYMYGGENKDTSVSLLRNENLIRTELITTISRRGVPLSGRLFISPAVVPGTPAPLAIYVYGGPQVQLVYEQDYVLLCKPFFQLLAKSGISVLVADGQMSSANGLVNLSICKKNMGNFETSDYVDLVKHLITSPLQPSGFIADPSRIAVLGWSYGGYATLLAMSQAPDVFKIGFAGAPVVDWTLYDTGYTERYMGELYEADACAGENPKKNVISSAYTKSAIKEFVAGFPDDLNRLYIAHGLLDENVHFTHTCALINALVNAGKPFSILAYPGERHGLRQNKISSQHHEAMVTKNLVETL